MKLVKLCLVISLLVSACRSEGGTDSPAAAHENEYNPFTQDPATTHTSPKYFDILIKKRNYACNPIIKQVFGIPGDSDQFRYVKTRSQERRFCPRVLKTCCRSDEMESYHQRFKKGMREVKRSLQVVQETMLTFQGNIFKEFLASNTLAMRDKCGHIFAAYKGKYTNEVDFFSQKVMEENLLTLFAVSNEMGSFLKSVRKIYGGVLCAVCSARTHHYFLFYKKHPVFKVSLSMCARLVEMRDFEYRLFKVYRDFLFPLAKGLVCLQDLETEREVLIEPLDKEHYMERKRILDSCKKEFDDDNPDCREVCKFSLFKYTFPRGLVPAYLETLKVFYEQFTRYRVESYYRRNKNYKIDSIETVDVEFTPLPQEESLKYLQMDKLEMVVSNNGLNVFLFPFKGASHALTVWAILLVFIGKLR
jgi:hypothetical protein